MRVIPVTSYPLTRSYDTWQEAVEGAKNNPRQPQAIADSERLTGSTIVDACWSDGDCAVRFSNELILHVVAVEGGVDWKLLETPPHTDEGVGRVGEEPIVLRWERQPRDSQLDRSVIAVKRRGAEFKNLFVNEFGLHLYCKKLLIWCFNSVRRTDLDIPFLYMCEDD